MKNKLLAMLLAGLVAVSVCACGDEGENNGTEAAPASETPTEAPAAPAEVKSSVVYDGPASCTMKLNYEEAVKDLPDYKGLNLTIPKSYELTQENKDAYLVSLMEYYRQNNGVGTSVVEITDRDTVMEGDIVNVDYTGYLDGEAFENGAASDQLIDVSGNCSLAGGGFIEGFTDCLVGAKVGETVSGDVTFPENYGSEKLAGQKATFEFVIHSVNEKITCETLTDEMVQEIVPDQNAESLKQYIDAYLQNQADGAAVTKAKEYMLANCTVEIPEEYNTARLYEQAALMEKGYCEGTNLEAYLAANYYQTLDDFYEGLKPTVEDETKTEVIFARIAQLENIQVDEEEFDGYVNYCMTSYYLKQTGQPMFADANELYEYFGAGDAEAGKDYMIDQYLVNKAVDVVADSALVTYE